MTDELTPLTSWAQANRETVYPEKGFGERKMIDRDALKAMLDAQSKALLESPEYAAAIGDALHGGAGLGVVRISEDGQIERIKPKDFFIDPEALERVK